MYEKSTKGIIEKLVKTTKSGHKYIDQIVRDSYENTTEHLVSILFSSLLDPFKESWIV